MSFVRLALIVDVEAAPNIFGFTQAAKVYPSVQVEEYPAEGGTLVVCHGGLAQEDPANAPARLQPFSEAWASCASANGKELFMDDLISGQKWLFSIYQAWLV